MPTPVSLGTVAPGTSETATVSLTTEKAANAGDTVVAILLTNGSREVKEIGGTNGLTWSKDVELAGSSPFFGSVSIWSARAPSGLESGKTIIFTLSSTQNSAKAGVALSVPGLLEASWRDKTKTNKESSQAWSTGESEERAQAKEISIAAGTSRTATPASSITNSPATELLDFTSGGRAMTVAYQNHTEVGKSKITGEWNVSAEWTFGLVTYKVIEEEAPPTTVKGSVELKGTASISVSGIRQRKGSVALSGSGSLAVSGLRGRRGSVALSGTGGLSVSGVRGRKGSVSLAGAAAISVAGKVVGEEGSAPRIVINREFPPSKVCVLVRDENDNLIGRHAEDESNIANVLQNLTKTGDMPGGHGELSYSLARDPKQSWPDIPLYAKLELQGVGGERLWSGTIWQKPEQDGERQAIEVKAIGDKQFLEDQEDVVGPGFIDRDMSKWGEPSTQRRLDLVSIGCDPNGFSVTTGWQGTGEAGPAIIYSAQAFGEKVELAEQVYDSGGVPIGAVYSDFYGPAESSEWSDLIYLGTDDRFSAALPSSDAHGKLATFVYVEAVYPDIKYAAIQSSYNGAYIGESVSSRRWSNMLVVGFNGLYLQGTWPNQGYLAKQMIPLIVAGSGLTTVDELIDDDEFIIPQAWYSDPATRMSKLVDVTKYGLLDWFVFNDRVLQYRKPGTYGRKWRLSPGNVPKNSGPDASKIFDRLTVTWQDVDGTTKRAAIGPITDERNPAVAAGRPRGKLLALNGVCTEKMAREAAENFLGEIQNLAQSGEATITGYIQDQYGTWYPAAYVQPGDEVTAAGATDYRRITSVSYSHDSKSASITLSSPPDGMASLEARFNAKLLELGLG